LCSAKNCPFNRPKVAFTDIFADAKDHIFQKLLQNSVHINISRKNPFDRKFPAA